MYQFAWVDDVASGRTSCSHFSQYKTTHPHPRTNWICWLIRTLVSFRVIGFFLARSPQKAHSQDRIDPNQASSAGNETPTVYVQVGGGLGASLMFSGDIKSLLDGEFVPGPGFHKSVSLMAGLLHIVEVEYRIGDADHTLRNNQFVGEDIATIAEVKMDYDYREFAAKLNPLFQFNSAGYTFFLVFGKGTVDYFDEDRSGFRGSNLIYGAELVRPQFTKGGSFMSSVVLGFRRQQVNFEEVEFLGMTFDPDMRSNDNIVYFGVRIGLGI